MMNFKRTRYIEREFGRLCFSEVDLLRIGSIFNRWKKEHEQAKLTITIVSLDGEDTITSEDPNIFSSSEIPRGIRSLEFSLLDKKTGTTIILDLPGSLEKYANLCVTSDDELLASGIFRELEKELKSAVIWGKWLKDFTDNFSGYLLLSLLCLLSITALYSFSLNVISLQYPAFMQMMLPAVLPTFYLFIIVAFASGAIVKGTLIKALAPVEYTGNLVGISSKYIRRIKWHCQLVILPIILNLIANVIIDYLI